MKPWLKDNWDKVLGVLTGLIISGVVGYFSGISATKDKLATQQEEIVRLKTVVNEVLKPKITEIESLSLDLQRLRNDMSSLSNRQDIAGETGQLLRLQIEEIRRQTVGNLQDLLASQGK